MGDLLKDAIADAKKVRATAIANARQTILETFQPSVQRIISSKIAEEDESELDPDVNIDIDLEGGDGMDEPAVGFGGGEEVPPPVSDEGEDEMPADDDVDMEIESLMREFDEEEDDMMEGDEENWDESAPRAIREENDEDGGSYTQAPPPESGQNSVGDLNEWEIDEILESMDGEDEDDMGLTEDEGYDDRVPEKNLNTESRRRIRTLEKDLREAYQAITVLKRTINEVNLLNAKLMFSQKVLHKVELSEPQKVKVLEAFDRANSVREVKSKYLDIMTLINKSTPGKRKMTEGSASRPARQIGKSKVNESYEFAPRWKQLANITPLED